jgi:hypothetical protein
VQGRCGVRRRRLAPHAVHEPVDRHDFARMQKQDGEHAALLHATEPQDVVGVSRLEGAEEPKFKAGRQETTVPRAPCQAADSPASAP